MLYLHPSTSLQWCTQSQNILNAQLMPVVVFFGTAFIDAVSISSFEQIEYPSSQADFRLRDSDSRFLLVGGLSLMVFSASIYMYATEQSLEQTTR